MEAMDVCTAWGPQGPDCLALAMELQPGALDAAAEKLLPAITSTGAPPSTRGAKGQTKANEHRQATANKHRQATGANV